MKLHDYIASFFKDKEPNILWFGVPPLLACPCRYVSPSPQNLVEGNDAVVSELTKDPHFVRVLDGYWVRGVTVEEIFRQWPGPYDVIGMNYEGMNRHIFWSEQVQASIPKIMAITEDGHNEEVRTRAIDRGYPRQPVIDGMLVMVHD